jgi:hypothetical protein
VPVADLVSGKAMVALRYEGKPLPPDHGGPLLLLSGGSGVVPLMSMLRHRAAQGSRVPALLLFSSRTFADVIFRDELLARAARNDGFQLALALTRDQPQRVGRLRPARRCGDGRRVSGKAARATPACLRLWRKSVRRGRVARREPLASVPP